MKFIITGGAGFIGSHLTEKIIYAGHQVIVIDNESTGTVQNLAAISGHPNFTYLFTNIQMVNCWEQILEKDAVIIHLAATVGVNKVDKDPLETLENNYMATILLLKLALRFQCKFFFASTSEVYGDSGKLYSTETDALLVTATHCGRTSYVLSKLLSEQYCMNYFRKYGLPVIVGRFFNVIGTRQLNTYGMVTPTFIKQALENKPITVYGDGSQTRNFCDVDDVATTIIKSLQTEAAYGEIFNIGGAENTTILAFAQYIKEATHSNSPIVYLPFPGERSNGRDVYYRSPSLAKIEAFTGWRPVIPWQDSVKAIIDDMVYQKNDSLKSSLISFQS